MKILSAIFHCLYWIGVTPEDGSWLGGSILILDAILVLMSFLWRLQKLWVLWRCHHVIRWRYTPWTLDSRAQDCESSSTECLPQSKALVDWCGRLILYLCSLEEVVKRPIFPLSNYWPEKASYVQVLTIPGISIKSIDKYGFVLLGYWNAFITGFWVLGQQRLHLCISSSTHFYLCNDSLLFSVEKRKEWCT